MYLRHFALTRFPFHDSVHTDELFESAAISEAEARLNHLLELKGIGVSEGVGIGHVHRIDRRRRRYPTHHVDSARVPAELARLAAAFRQATDALDALA